MVLFVNQRIRYNYIEVSITIQAVKHKNNLINSVIVYGFFLGKQYPVIYFF